MKKQVVLLAATMLLISTLVGAMLVFRAQAEGTSPDGASYSLAGPTIDQDFRKGTGKVLVDDYGTGAQHAKAKNGLLCSFNSHRGEISIKLNPAADTVALSMNILGMVHYRGQGTRVTFSFGEGDERAIRVIFDIGYYNVSLAYLCHIDGVTETKYADFLYDLVDNVNLLVQVRGSSILTGMNGIGDAQTFASLNGFSPTTTDIGVGPSASLDSRRSLTIFHLQSGLGTLFTYHDRLHKTIVPDGRDMGFSLHMHADRAYLQHFEIMAELARQYGLKGTYDAWVKGNSEQYGMDTPEYVSALHLLEDAGWDIGIHAGAPRDLPRDAVVQAIERISSEYGPIRTWSDHGARLQDLFQQGNTPGSAYCVKDLVQAIGAGWLHINTISHCPGNDLNRWGMNFSLAGFEDIPLFRVSKQQALNLYFEQGRQHNASSWLRGMVSDRSLFLSHDYMPYFFYFSNQTGSYSIFPEHNGIANVPWSGFLPKLAFQNCTWHPLPRFVEMLESMRGHSMWFTTIRDAYDRSCLVQKVMVVENATHVKIVNGNSLTVSGLTLFTQGSPGYFLSGGSGNVFAEKGSLDSWHFVLDLQPGEELILEKRSMAPSHLALGMEISGVLLPNNLMAREAIDRRDDSFRL